VREILPRSEIRTLNSSFQGQRDKDGSEREVEGPVAVLVERYDLDNPAKWLSDTRRWDYVYQSCEACGGTGTRA